MISGLGAIIIISANNFDTATTFVPVIIIMLLAVMLNFAVGAIERWVAPWQAEIPAAISRRALPDYFPENALARIAS